VPDFAVRELTFFRYRERFHLSYAEAAAEPWAEIERAVYIWSLDKRRDKVESARQAAHNGRDTQLNGS
jgi:hypothetical protein